MVIILKLCPKKLFFQKFNYRFRVFLIDALGYVAIYRNLIVLKSYWLHYSINNEEKYINNILLNL